MPTRGGLGASRSIAPAIAVVGIGLLIYWTSTARPMWVDEEMLALNVRDRGFRDLAGALWLDQSAPLGWLAIERLVMLLFGTSERAVRLVTIGFGAATLGTAVWIGRRWMTPFGAAVLVALCAFGEWIVFFTLELKHYSADTFCALALPALAAWTIETVTDTPLLRRRVTIWWTAAAIGLWFGNGALFVTPACAVVLFLVLVRGEGRPAASRFVMMAALWLASFGLSYVLVLRHALANEYLRTYWAFAFPPVSEGVVATIRWVLAQIGPFAGKPAGSGLWRLFWLAWAIGTTVAIRRRRPIGVFFALVPLSAIVLAIFHVVPTFERLALWVVPSVYVGVALCADAAVCLVRQGRSRAQPLAMACGIVAGIVALTVGVEAVHRGARALAHRPHSNYGLDDRSSVRWLLAAHHPGDAVLTTHYGLVAIWWYGGLNVSDATATGRLRDGSQIFEVGHVPPGGDCARWNQEVDAALGGHARAVVYLGFRLNVEPVGFDNLVLQELGRRGALVSYKPFAEESRLAVFELGRNPASDVIIPGDQPAADSVVPQGCMSIRPARRW